MNNQNKKIEVKLSKWNLKINNLNDILILNDINKAIMIAENLFETAILFESMTIPQDELSKRYFEESILIYENIIKPNITNIENDINIKTKIDKLEEMIRDLDIEIIE